MKGTADESVGEGFRNDLLREARDRTLEVIERVAAQIRPGTTEGEAKALLMAIQSELGALKSWHPPQIRFGENSVLAFGQRGIENNALRANDIFFLDIGPIFEGHEGDVGRTFAVGDDSEMHRCASDVAEVWRETRDYWSETRATGAALYAFARQAAESRGWTLLVEQANGHRIADFPHAARARGSIEGFSGAPAPDRWILEIQIRHPKRPFGAFYEDLLN
jgi:Xaa-Pro aminopeptidase